MSSFDLIAIMLLLVALLGTINHRYIGFPRTIGLMTGALVLSMIVLVIDPYVDSIDLREIWLGIVTENELPKVFLDEILVLMLFAGALHVDVGQLRHNKWLVLTLATVGVLVATALYGCGAWLLFGGEVPFLWCLVLGAVLAPTDPIAVAGVLKQSALPPGLKAVIGGESLFNDGVAVVVFALAVSVAEGAGGPIGLGSFAATMAKEAVGGIVLGLITGYMAYAAIRAVDEATLELAISLALVAGTNSVAHVLHVSGPLAVVVAGLIIGHSATRFAMSETTRRHLTLFWDLTDELLNAILFLLLGFSFLSLEHGGIPMRQVLGGVALALVVRFVSVSVPAMMGRPSVSDGLRVATVLTWGGLRGGISVALVLGLTATPYIEPILTVCYAVVVFTIMVQGLTMPLLIRRLFGSGHEGDHDRE